MSRSRSLCSPGQPRQGTFVGRGYYLLLGMGIWIIAGCELTEKPTAAAPPLLEGRWQQASSRMTVYRYDPGRGTYAPFSAFPPDRAALSVVVQDGHWAWQGSGEDGSYPYTHWGDSLEVDPGDGYPRWRWTITELTAHRLRVRWQLPEADTSFRKVIEYHFSR